MRKLGAGKIHPSLLSQRRSKGARKLKRRFSWFLNFRKNWQRRFRKLRRISPRYLIFFSLSLAFTFLAYLVFFSPLFRLRTITVEFTPAESDVEVESLRQEIKKKVQGDNLLFLNLEKTSFLDEELTYQEVKKIKHWPNCLEIRIRKRIPRAVLEDSSQAHFLVDDEGVVFSRGTRPDLPVIKYSGTKLSLGDQVKTEEIDFVLYIISRASDEGLLLESLRVGLDTHLKLVDGPEIFLPLGDKELVDGMIKIVKDFRSRGAELSKIDLRYAHPVIEY